MGKRGLSVVLFALMCIFLYSCAPITVEPQGRGFIDDESSTVYGKLVDQNNRPIAGELIIAEWQEKGVVHTAQTVTLSKEDALGLGDAGLEGVFLFSRGEIVAPDSTPVTLKTLPRFTSVKVTASPGEAVDAGRMMLLRSTSPPLSAEEKQREQVEVVFGYVRMGEKLDAYLSGARWWIGGVYAAALIGMLAFFFMKNRRKEGAVADFIFRKDMDSLESMKVEEIMAKDIVTISPDETVQEALEAMMHHHINGIVVAEGKKVRGILTETDFLRKVHGNNDALKSKVSEVMTAPILTIQSSAIVLSVVKLMLKRGIRKVPVVKDNELVGIVSFSDVLRLFHGFFKKHPGEKGSVLLDNVEKCCQKEMLVVGRMETFGEIVKLMRERNISYVLVSDAGLSSDRGMIRFEEEMGIITTKDLLDELYKNPHGFEHLKAVNVMRTPLLTVDNSKNIAEALEIMEENAIRRIPVKSYNRIVGMLTQPPLLSAIVEYMEKTKEGKKK